MHPNAIRIAISIMLHGICCLLGMVLPFAAWHLKDPLFLAFRFLEILALLLMSLVGFVVLARLRSGYLRRLLTVSLVATVALTLYGEIGFRYRKATVLSVESAGASNIGQHFIVGYDDLNSVQTLAGKGLIGGIFVTRHNAAGKTVEALRAEIAALQAVRKTAGLPPLIVATDQEGGIVARLSPPLPRQPALADLVNLPDRFEKAFAYGKEQGQALAALGVTVNFSPVVDLKLPRMANPLDFHSLIGQRAISADPAVTADLAQAYIRGLESVGVVGTLKHFPGLGRIAEDTHYFSATLDTPVSVLAETDWRPFRQIARNSHALIMLGHVVMPEIDAENPASFSHDVIQKIIRGQWKHEGILITDDLTMGAAFNRGLCSATIKAFNAGVDLLLLSYDHEKFYDAMYCAIRAKEKGELDMEMLVRSQRRLD